MNWTVCELSLYCLKEIRIDEPISQWCAFHAYLNTLWHRIHIAIVNRQNTKEDRFTSALSFLWYLYWLWQPGVTIPLATRAQFPTADQGNFSRRVREVVPSVCPTRPQTKFLLSIIRHLWRKNEISFMTMIHKRCWLLCSADCVVVLYASECNIRHVPSFWIKSFTVLVSLLQ